MLFPSYYFELTDQNRYLRSHSLQEIFRWECNRCLASVIRLISKYTCIYRIYTHYTNIYVQNTNKYGCENHIRLCTYSSYSVRMLSVYAFVYCSYDACICLYGLYTYVFLVPKPVRAPVQTHTNYTYTYKQNTDNLQTTYKQLTNTYKHYTAGRPYGFWYKKKHGTTVCCSYMFVYGLYNIQYTYVFLCWICLYMSQYTSFGGKCTEPWQWRNEQIYTHIRMYTSNTDLYLQTRKRGTENNINTDEYKHIRIIRTFCRIPILTS